MQKYGWWAVWGWATLILVLSALRVPNITAVNTTHLDKVAHWGMYGIFTFILLFLPHLNQKTNFARYTIAAVSAILYGILMEILQNYFFSARSFDILDILANITGVFSAAICFYFFYTKPTNTP